MSARLVLVGAGDHGRGTLEILRARVAAGLEAPEVVGFVDDAPELAGKSYAGLPVLGDLAWLIERARGEGYLALVALAATGAKEKIAARLGEAEVPLASAVHPSVFMAGGVEVAPGSILGAGVVVAHDTHIGPHVTINLNATIGHDVVIGAAATIAPGVNVAGRVTIGAAASIQTNATIIPGLRIGDRAEVGPGSVVLRDVAAGARVFGNPARPLPGARGNS